MLSHSSGLGYDQLHPLLTKWRASRGELPWTAPTLEERCNSPLMFEPGTSWMYGCGLDWAGKLVERATGESLETFMMKNIWSPLGIKDITFWPKQRLDMQHRMADLSSWTNRDGSGKAVPLTTFSIVNGSVDCLGGGGASATAQDFMTLLKVILREDDRLLKKESYDELFLPQLSEESERALHDVLASSQYMWEELGGFIPLDSRISHGLGGILSRDSFEDWMGANTLHWQGMPNLSWV